MLDCERSERGLFNGEIRSEKLEAIQFSEVISDPQHVVRSKRQISRSSESEFLLSLQLESTGRVSQDGREAILTPGDFVIYDSTRPYTLDFKSPFHQLVLQIPHHVLCRYLQAAEDYTARSISGQFGAGLLASQLLKSVAVQSRELVTVRRQIEDNIFSMLAVALGSSKDIKAINAPSAVRANQLRRVKQFVENNLHNEKLSPQLIARDFRVSTRYLHKLFQGEKLSLSRFILQRRLEKCREMLADGRYLGHRIEQIAFNWGFNSLPHFSQAFKSYTGFSPRDYRQRQMELQKQ